MRTEESCHSLVAAGSMLEGETSDDDIISLSSLLVVGGAKS